MDLLIDVLIRSVFAIFISASLPFIWWFIKYRKGETFTSFVGLTKPTLDTQFKYIMIVIGFYILFLVFDFTVYLPEQAMDIIRNHRFYRATYFHGLGQSAILPILVHSFIGDGISQELFFRGFLVKRLKKFMPNQIAYIVQALMVSLIYIVFFISQGAFLPVSGYIVLLLFVSIPSYLLALLSDHFCGGSIIPSILLNGLGKSFLHILLAFSAIGGSILL